MRNILKSLAFAGSVLISSQAFAQDQVNITSLTYGGSGCASGTASGALYDVDSNGFSDQFAISFSKFIAFQPGTPADVRKNCTIKLGLHVPQGFQFSLASVEYEGAADLPKGVYGRQKSEYEFPFWSNSLTFQTVLAGPYNDGPGFTKDYKRQDDIVITSLVWSKCGLDTPLEIETSVELAGDKKPDAQMTVDNIDGFVKQIYGMVWRPCS